MNPIRIQAEVDYVEGVITSDEYFEKAHPYMSQEEIDKWLLDNKNTFDLMEQKLKKYSKKEVEKSIKSIKTNCLAAGDVYEKYKHFGSQKLRDMLEPD